ncbi:MAG: NAD-dependent epimerase/dehydratase family protein [bacterium]|nr:NAD-dependent epimerase/dehydratase family protein [bacterium]
MSVIVVTGGAGFIGSNLAEELFHQGHEVRVIDNFISGRLDNLVSFIDGITLYDADILDPAALDEALAGADIVFHLAAVTPVPQSLEDPVTTTRTNEEGTVRVLDHSRRAGVKLVVFASSAAVYGNPEKLPLIEESTLGPLSPYAVSKLAGEYYCRVFSNLFGLQTISLRFFNVYGPRQDPDSSYAAVVPKFISTYLQGSRPVIFGDGNQTRDFAFVEDVVQVCCLLLKHEGQFNGDIINISTGRSTTVNELARVVRSAVGSGEKPEHGAERSGDIKHSVANISRAQKLLGYDPGISLETGLKRTVEWYRARVSNP